MIWTIVGIIGFAVVPAIFLWFIVEGLCTGVIRARGSTYSRTEDPFWFWAVVFIDSALIVWFLFLAAKIAFEM